MYSNNRWKKEVAEKPNMTNRIAQMDTSVPIKQYISPVNTNIGPIGFKPAGYTFYDLVTSISMEDTKLKEISFEDWAFPIINSSYENGIVKTTVNPNRIIRRGFRTNDDGTYNDETIISTTKEIVQYIYIILNGLKMPVGSFGSIGGMAVTRSNFIVCLEVGDPRSGYLGNTHIKYALPLNTPINECVHLVNKEIDPEDGEMYYYYAIIGNKELEDEIQTKWFDQTNHLFNGMIYPKIRPFVDWDALAGVK